MASLQTDKIRNVVVIGAGGAGKTSLVDALLFKAGSASRQGKVNDGTSLSDHTAEEKAAKHSLYATLLSAEHRGHKINMLDTPGYSDFVGEASICLGAADMALVVIGANGNINANTRRLYHAAKEAGLPRMVLVNKMDSEQADVDATMDAIQSLFGTECCKAFQPDGVGGSFSAVKSLLDADAPEDERNAMIEALVETDEAAMEKYLEDGEVADDEVAKLYHKAIAAGMFVPVLFCSVEKDIGVGSLLDKLIDFVPPPNEAPGRPGRRGSNDGEEVVIRPGASEEVIAQVFKTVTDPFVGKLSYLRLWSGNLNADVQLASTNSGKHARLQNLLKVQGKDSEGITEAIAGDILAVAKAENLETGDTLYSGDPVFLKPIEVPPPMVSLAIDPASRGEEQKLATALKKLASEDLTFLVNRDQVTKELVVSGVTNLHLETMLKRLKEQFGVEVESRLPRVPFQETVMAAAEGHHRHKKQSGGAGQFGEVYLRVRPSERGEGFKFVDAVVGGAIPKNFMPAVEKGINAALENGVYAGYPVVDVTVEVYDGKHHPVDSNEASFKTAGAKAFKDAFLKAKPSLLEPVVDMVVEVPASAMGDITGDLNTRRGRIQGMDTVGSLQIINVQVPLKEIQSYSTDLRSMTAGEGSFTFKFSHYDVVPAKNAEEIRAQFKDTDDD